MIKAETMALRAGADLMPRKMRSFSNRATKPKIVVTPVEMRQRSRQVPYTATIAGMPMTLHTVRVGMVAPPSTEV